MDDEYDIIILGTGLKECILSALMSKEGKKVLHIGGDSASINPLEKLYKMFNTDGPPESLGRGQDWNVDLIPKFLMADGALVKLLIHTGVDRYIEFKSIEGSHVFKSIECGYVMIRGNFVYKAGNIHKVPCNMNEAFRTTLMRIDDRKRLKAFLEWAMAVDLSKPETYDTMLSDPSVETINQAYLRLAVRLEAVNFVGHIICLYMNDDYIHNVPAIEVIKRVQLYINSFDRYGQSPYLYPLHGLGELPQGFARCSADYGGTFMLNKQVEELVYDEQGRICGVKADGEVAQCKAVICDPSYVPHKVKKTGSVIRAICLLTHAIPDTNNALSTHITIPQYEVNRKHDIYVCCVSYTHRVASQHNFLALVSTTVETEKPQDELQPGLKLLGEIEETFYIESDLWEPIEDGTETGVYVSTSYDATTHFETTCRDVLNIYARYNGAEFDFAKIEMPEDE